MSKVYKIAEGKRVYAIGDIHGFAGVLDKMHEAIDADLAANPVETPTIVYLGDYIDRGPDSKGVIDRLIARPDAAPHIEHIFLMGNHENGMMGFMKEPTGKRLDWLPWGGVEALESYGIEVDRDTEVEKQAKDLSARLVDVLPVDHQKFLDGLVLMHEVDDYLFAHAGIRPGVAIADQVKQDLTFTREPFMSHEGHHSHRVVHGHTITKNRDVDLRPNRINTDSGLYEGGPLSCVVIEGEEVRVLQVWQS